MLRRELAALQVQILSDLIKPGSSSGLDWAGPG